MRGSCTQDEPRTSDESEPRTKSCGQTATTATATARKNDSRTHTATAAAEAETATASSCQPDDSTYAYGASTYAYGAANYSGATQASSKRRAKI